MAAFTCLVLHSHTSMHFHMHVVVTAYRENRVLNRLCCRAPHFQGAGAVSLEEMLILRAANRFILARTRGPRIALLYLRSGVDIQRDCGRRYTGRLSIRGRMSRLPGRRLL